MRKSNRKSKMAERKRNIEKDKMDKNQSEKAEVEKVRWLKGKGA